MQAVCRIIDICEVARAIIRGGGKTDSQAIAIAISRVKKWCSTGEPKTKAKACKAVAQWEALRAKSKAKTAAKVAASGSWDDDIVFLAASYNVDIIRRAWQTAQDDARNAWASGGSESLPPDIYVKEVWNDHIIVCAEYNGSEHLFKIPYEVDDKENVDFGEASEVKVRYVEIDDSGVPDSALEAMMSDDSDCGCLSDVPVNAGLSVPTTPAISKLLSSRKPRVSLLDPMDPSIMELSVLTTKGRKRLDPSDFAIPPDRYPIHDLAHGRNALARVSQFGTPEEKKKVRAAVCRRYPALCKSNKD